MKEDKTELELIKKLDELVDDGKLQDRDTVCKKLAELLAKVYKKEPIPEPAKPITVPNTEDSKLIRKVIDKFLTGAIKLSPSFRTRYVGGKTNAEWGFGICSRGIIFGNEVCLVWRLRRDENAPRSENDPGDVYLYVASGMYDYWDRSKARAHCVATDDIYASMRTLRSMCWNALQREKEEVRQREEKTFANDVEYQRKLLCACLGLKEENAEYTKDDTDVARQGFILSQLLTGPMIDWDAILLREYPAADGRLLSFAVVTQPSPEKAHVGIGFEYQKNLHKLSVMATLFSIPGRDGFRSPAAISMVLNPEDPWAKAMEGVILKIADRYEAEQRVRQEKKTREEEAAKERKRKEAEESIARTMKMLAE